MKKGFKNDMDRSGSISAYTIGEPYSGSWKIMFHNNKLSYCPATRKILGLTKVDEGKNGSVFGLIQPSYLRKLLYHFKIACAGKNTLNASIKIITPQGREKWLQISGMVYSRRWGKGEQMIGTVEDITQQVKEECMCRAIVNHEMCTPLTIIKLNTQFLIDQLSQSFNKKPLKLLQVVDQHVNGISRLLDEYLSSAIDEERMFQLNPTLIDLAALIESVLGEMKILYPGHRFYRNGLDTIWILADKFKIMQVLINYLTNAVKFSPPCSPIVVHVDVTDKYAEVAVCDQGVGISAECGEQLFQECYQNTSTKRSKNSRGLGLYIVKQIIKKHGGEVRAENGQNGGAIFYFSLPIREAAAVTGVGKSTIELVA
jgi:two-component system sensor histidine kinase VicK